ncbi:hypothetical protein EDC01DRAFT_628268 [Geopyxis carbonaria]|nr:hypothetical protein EDC01DRAFT_628268 [Geopyxis carbonaria]
MVVEGSSFLAHLALLSPSWHLSHHASAQIIRRMRGPSFNPQIKYQRIQRIFSPYQNALDPQQHSCSIVRSNASFNNKPYLSFLPTDIGSPARVRTPPAPAPAPQAGRRRWSPVARGRRGSTHQPRSVILRCRPWGRADGILKDMHADLIVAAVDLADDKDDDNLAQEQYRHDRGGRLDIRGSCGLVENLETHPRLLRRPSEEVGKGNQEDVAETCPLPSVFVGNEVGAEVDHRGVRVGARSHPRGVGRDRWAFNGEVSAEDKEKEIKKEEEKRKEHHIPRSMEIGQEIRKED